MCIFKHFYPIRCEKFPKRRCHTTYKNECTTKQKCRTIQEEKCTRVPKKECKDVKVKMFDEIVKFSLNLIPPIPMGAHSVSRGFWIKFQKLLIRPEQGKRVCIRVSWHSRLMAIESASLADLAWIGHNQLSYQAGNS